MSIAKSGDLSVRFPVKYKDEISWLGQSFNNLVEQIDHLIKKLIVAQDKKRIAEIKLLQEQIKPHFLYNTLDTISWMAREHGANDVVLLVDELTNIFRIWLSQGKEVIPLTEEIAHIKSYLYIQKVRYKDKLRYMIADFSELNDVMIPKLSLQPIIENALYHGIKNKRGGGLIEVNYEILDDQICIIVKDDGVGIEENMLNSINDALCHYDADENLLNFGLLYIQQRLKTYFSAKSGIEIQSEKGIGTTVFIRLPSTNKERKPAH